MTLENKIKSFAKKASSLALVGILGCSLATGCSKRHANKVLGSPVSSVTEKTSGYTFCGEPIEASVVPTYRPVTEVIVKTTLPDGTSSSEYLTDGDGDGKYTKKIAPTTQFGNYNFEFNTRSGQMDETTQTTVPVYMNEAQSDSALSTILSPMIKTGSTTNYDITNTYPNMNMGMGFPTPTMYNDDIILDINDSSVGGGQRMYIIDIQGSLTDIYNSTKKSDADSVNISYKNIEPVSSNSDLESKINELKNNNWKRTDQ